MSVVTEAKLASSRRSQWRWSVAVLLAVGLIWGVWSWWVDRNYRDAITQIELEMANGRFGIAAHGLTRLLERWPDCGEAAVLLARCEQERGHNEAAAKALAQVESGSLFAHKAILARMRLAHDRGQLAAAEEIINTAAADPRNDTAHIRFLLVPIYSQLGRLDEAERLIEEWWEHLNEMREGASESAIDLVRMHIQLTFKPNPVSNILAYLEPATSLAPDDDRVWLGQANLAIRTGAYDKAQRWLDACLKRRPDDVPVWCARLNWSIATNQPNTVRQALKHLPAEDSTPAQVHRLRAWLAAQRGDITTEHQELECLLEADPADRTALGRLAELMEKAGQSAPANELLHKKAEIDQLRARYEKLYDRNQPIRDAEEMASLAQQLCRQFEARVFLTVAISEEPERDDLRQNLQRLTSQSSKQPSWHGKTLAEVMEDGASR